MKRKKFIIGFILLALLIGGGVVVWQRTIPTTTLTANLQTTPVRRGTISATVSATGNVAAARTAKVTSQTAGRVTQVNVQIGDRVKAGQTLVQLDLTDLNITLRTAQLSLVSAQANYDNAKAKNAQNANSFIIAKASLEKARIAVQAAQSDYDAVAWRAGSASTSQATALQQATIEYTSAQASYNSTAATINDTDLKTAQVSLDKAKLDVEQAQLNLDKARIVAPFDGIVTSVSVNVGDNASAATTTTSATTAVEIFDPSRLQISVTVSEVDIAKVKVGQTATVTMDALSGKTYTAQVATISPAGTVTSGVVNYSVVLNLTNADESVRPGMTSNLTIEVDKREGVLIVPPKAVRTVGPQKVVTTLVNGQLVPKTVTGGLSNDQSIEIVSGLNEGDIVVINQSSTSTRTTGQPGMIGGGGPIMGGSPPGQ